MTNEAPEMLTEAVLNLQSELDKVASVQKLLAEASQRLDKADEEWKSRTAEHQRTTTELVQATKDAIQAMQDVTQKSSIMASALVPLAVAIKNVNFPLRLDKIDMAVTTQASTLAAFQAEANRRFDILSQIKASLARFGWVMVAILGLNTLALVMICIRLYL